MAEGPQATVLVVEDETPLVEIYARWLEEDYEVRTAESGEEALDRLDGDVDVVLLDRLMPGLSGDEVLEQVRARGFDCRVAMVTAVEPDFDVITMGFDDYLVKPIDRETLLSAVEGLISRSSFADLEQQFYALASKQAALQSSKSAEELASNPQYQQLEEEIDTVREQLDETMPEIGDGDFVALVRDIEESHREAESDDV